MKKRPSSPNSVEVALEGLFDRPLAEIPAEKRVLIERICPRPWDELYEDQRRYCARLWDRQEGLADADQDQQEFGEEYNRLIRDEWIKERNKTWHIELDADKSRRLEVRRNRNNARQPRDSRKKVTDEQILKYAPEVARQRWENPHNFISSLRAKLEKEAGITITDQALRKRVRNIESKHNINLFPKKKT